MNLLVSRDGAAFVLGGKSAALVYMRVVGSSPAAQALGQEELSSHGNYLIGKDPKGWRTNVKQFGSVRVREILPHTDIVFYGGPGKLEYDLLLRPGADVDAIRLRFEGVDIRPTVDDAGNLVIRTEGGEIVEHKPKIEQDGKIIDGRFLVEANGDVRFQIGSYDRMRTLRIDPVISYSTYLGGTAGDSPNAVAVDAVGNAYVTGATSSFNFPVTPGALQTSFPSSNATVAFVAKLNPSGTGLVYTTFLGGSGVNGGDSANAIAVDAGGNAYVAGATGSANFPVTQGALASTLHGPTDAFIAKINPTGTALIYGTYLGGAATETAAALAVDAAGSVYVTGSTSSSNFPVTSGAPQSILKSANDAFVTKLNPAGSALVYSTYLGGSAEDDGHGIAVDSTGSAYVTGSTASADFPVTAAAFQKTIGPSAVAFAVKVNPAGTGFTYSTFLGGTGGDSGNAISVDAGGNAYLAGTTFSADLPTTVGVLSATTPGSAAYGHAFLSKLSATGAGLVYSTYLGGANADGANGLAIDGYGNATLVGFTNSANFPVAANPAEPVANFNPAGFLTTINQSGTAIVYSTMLGATGLTVAQAVALDSTNHAYVAGYTGSLTFPGTPGTFQSANGSSSPLANTGFVMKLDLGSAVTCPLSFSPGSVGFPLNGGAVTVSVVAPSGCAWEVTSGSNWITVNPPSSAVGPGTVTITAGSNEMSLSSRSATVNAGSAALTVTQVAGSCSTPQFSPASPQTFAAAGGTGSVAVAIPASCPVTASSTLSWVTINSGASVTGDDLVTFTVASNAGIARSGIITIAGTPYTISQSGTPTCGTSLTPATLSFAASGGSFTATLVTPSGCTWTASWMGSWLTVSPASGTGSTTLTLTAAANTSSASRGAIVMAAGLSITLTQSASVPTADSVVPGVGSGSSQVFTAVFSDTAGVTFLNDRTILFNSVLNGGNSCMVQIVPGGTYLLSDTGAAYLGPLTVGGTLTNSQCTLNAVGSSVTNSGNTSTIVVSLTFAAAFAGVKNIYMNVGDTNGNQSGWQTRGAYTVVAPLTLSPVSVTPSSASGSSQAFTAVFSDTAGATYLNDRTILFNSVLNGGSACMVQVVPGGTYLLSDSGAAYLGPLTASGTISNSQCTLSGSGNSVSNSGNNSTVTVSITFAPAFSGVKNIYMNVGDTNGNHSSWQTMGTYNVLSSGGPTPVSVTPSSGSGSSQLFTAVFSDTAGAAYLIDRTILFNSVLNAGGACMVQVVPGGTYLLNDSGAAYLGPLTASGTVTNSQCTLSGVGTSVANAGNTSTIVLSITFLPAFAGVKNIYLNAGDTNGNHSAWLTMGTYGVLSSGAATPVSITPSSGSGSSQVFTAMFSDTAGLAYLNDRTILFNSVLNGGNACMVQVVPGGTYLLSDSGAAYLGPLTASGTISNSQCTLNGSGSSVSNAGNNSTVTVSITFTPVFAGVKNIYLNAGDTNGNHSAWLTMGTYGVLSSGTPTPVSITPSSGSGSSQVFTAVFSDTAGVAYLNDRTILFNSVLSGGNACMVQVVPGGTYLLSDSGAAYLGPLTASGTISNSQCTLNGSGSSVSNAGNTSTIVISITFTPAFAGVKNIYMNVGDTNGNHSPWPVMGTYNP